MRGVTKKPVVNCACWLTLPVLSAANGLKPGVPKRLSLKETDRLVAVVENETLTSLAVNAPLVSGTLLANTAMVTATNSVTKTDTVVAEGTTTMHVDTFVRGKGFFAMTPFVPTDERLRTNIPGVYAVGDLVPGLQLAHRGFAHGVFVAEDIASLNPAPVLDRNIPKVTYCDPEIASVGLTEAAARAEHGEVRAYEYNLGGNGKSQILGTSGFVSVVRVVDGPVVGIHMIGARMGEQIGEAQLVVGWDAMPEDVAPLVHAHPTQNEALGEAHLALAGKPLHAHA